MLEPRQNSLLLTPSFLDPPTLVLKGLTADAAALLQTLRNSQNDCHPAADADSATVPGMGVGVGETQNKNSEVEIPKIIKIDCLDFTVLFGYSERGNACVF